MSDTHVLYRLYNDGDELLYIGRTISPPQRFSGHRHTKDWWSEVANIKLETFDTHEALSTAETEAILAERPRYNIAKTAPGKRPRVPPPVVPLSAIREVAGYSRQDLCDRIKERHGLLLHPDVLRAYEIGCYDFSPELVAAITDALGIGETVPSCPEWMATA